MKIMEDDLLVPIREESVETYAKFYQDTEDIDSDVRYNRTKVLKSTVSRGRRKVRDVSNCGPPPCKRAKKTSPGTTPRISPIILKAINSGNSKSEANSYIVKSPAPQEERSDELEKTSTITQEKKGRPRKGAPPKIKRYGKRGRPSRQDVERVRLQEALAKAQENDTELDHNQEDSKTSLKETSPRKRNYQHVKAIVENKNEIKNKNVKLENDADKNASVHGRRWKCPKRFAEDYVYIKRTRGRPKLISFCSIQEFCEFGNTKVSQIEKGIHPNDVRIKVEDKKHMNNSKIIVKKGRRGRPRKRPPVVNTVHVDENGQVVKKSRGRPRIHPKKDPTIVKRRGRPPKLKINHPLPTTPEPEVFEEENEVKEILPDVIPEIKSENTDCDKEDDCSHNVPLVIPKQERYDDDEASVLEPQISIEEIHETFTNNPPVVKSEPIEPIEVEPVVKNRTKENDFLKVFESKNVMTCVIEGKETNVAKETPAKRLPRIKRTEVVNKFKLSILKGLSSNAGQNPISHKRTPTEELVNKFKKVNAGIYPVAINSRDQLAKIDNQKIQSNNINSHHIQNAVSSGIRIKNDDLEIVEIM